MMYNLKKKNISVFGVVFSMIAGLMIQVLFYNAFEIDMNLLPIQFILALWVVFSISTYSFFKQLEI